MPRTEADFFSGKSILVTGASGSVGQVLVRELLRLGPRVVRLFDHDENGLWEFQERFRDEKRLRFLLGDVRSPDRLQRAAEDVDLVYHLAALKHVPSCEYNPFEAVQTNVLGTQNVIEAAMASNAEKVVLTSTDKAANPSNVMGATKLLAEKLIVAANYYRGRRRTAFACVRFGNLVGSRGSAYRLFQDQLANGGPVTVTDRRMSRFAMTTKDAIRLLMKATALARGGETFILRMNAVKVLDLLDVVAEGMGVDRHKIVIQTIGTRPGEKLYEELMTEEEVARAYELPDMYLLLPNMPELFPVDPKAYPGARPARRVPYRSDRARKLTRSQVAALVRAEEKG